MGWGTGLGSPQEFVLLQTNHAMPAKPLYSPLTFSGKLLILLAMSWSLAVGHKGTLSMEFSLTGRINSSELHFRKLRCLGQLLIL